MDLLENVGRRSEAKGDVGNFVDVGVKSLNGYERNCLYRNLGRGESFVDTAYLTASDRIEDGRGVAALDLENDGDLDLVIENYLQPVRLLVNRGLPGRRWVELDLVGAGARRGGSNTSGLGARALVRAGGRTQSKQVISASGYLSGTSHTLHFGLGEAAAIDQVEIRWPSGRVQKIDGLAIDRKHRIEEPLEAPAAARAGG